MTSKGIPKSRAKTAYGLLSEVRALILAEPKRYHQGTYIERVTDCLHSVANVEVFPACGTVGCVAGWVATLKHHKSFNWTETPYIATDILGLTDEQAEALFDESAALGSPQTTTHAKSGAKHIARFQHKHRGQLLAMKVSK